MEHRTRIDRTESDPESTAPFACEPFHVARWMRHPHGQTVVGRLLRSAQRLETVRQRLETADGDFIDIDRTRDPGSGVPVALIVHGLGGNSSRVYVRRTLAALQGLGIAGIAMNLRGCSGEPNRRLRAYHSGETTDVVRVLEWIRHEHPGAPVAVIGYSLGGNILLKLLGERDDGGTELVEAAVAVSVPFDLAVGARALETGPWGRVYTHYFLRSLKRTLRAKRHLAPESLFRASLASRTIRQWDEAFTAPVHGFRDAAEYYRLSSSAGFVDGIRTTTLVLQSRDDPFHPFPAVPVESLERNPSILPCFTDSGGHLGFMEGPPWRTDYWAERTAARFVAWATGGT